MDEQFIQDAISRPERLKRLLHQLGKVDWEFQHPADVLNQEFNFSAESNGVRVGGRMDVIATFNGRKRLAIVETKVAATAEDLKQLSWYISKCPELKGSASDDFRATDFSETVGILLASTFSPGIYDVPKVHEGKIHLVQFEFRGEAFPFHKFEPNVREGSNDSCIARQKHSSLITMDDRRRRIPNDLLEYFDELRRLCLPPGDSRLDWVIENPKSGHVAIHYKGIYTLFFFLGATNFQFGFTARDGKEFRGRMQCGAKENQSVMNEARYLLPQLIAFIDDSQRRIIPSAFEWSRF